MSVKCMPSSQSRRMLSKAGLEKKTSENEIVYSMLKMSCHHRPAMFSNEMKLFFGDNFRGGAIFCPAAAVNEPLSNIWKNLIGLLCDAPLIARQE